jgi:hypothetical protein
MYRSPGIDQIVAELIRAGGNTLCSEIHKLINSILNKEELSKQFMQYSCLKVIHQLLIRYSVFSRHWRKSGNVMRQGISSV